MTPTVSADRTNGTQPRRSQRTKSATPAANINSIADWIQKSEVNGTRTAATPMASARSDSTVRSLGGRRSMQARRLQQSVVLQRLPHLCLAGAIHRTQRQAQFAGVAAEHFH